MEGDAVHRTAARLDTLAGATLTRADLRHPGIAGTDLRGARLLPKLRAAITLDSGVSLVGLGIPVLGLLETRDEHRVVGHLGPDARPGRDVVRP